MQACFTGGLGSYLCTHPSQLASAWHRGNICAWLLPQAKYRICQSRHRHGCVYLLQPTTVRASKSSLVDQTHRKSQKELWQLPHHTVLEPVVANCRKDWNIPTPTAAISGNCLELNKHDSSKQSWLNQTPSCHQSIHRSVSRDLYCEHKSELKEEADN